MRVANALGIPAAVALVSPSALGEPATEGEPPPAHGTILALHGGVVQSDSVTVGGEIGGMVAFPLTSAVRVGGSVDWFNVAETIADYGDSARGFSFAVLSEAHVLGGWFDPYFGVDVGLVVGSRTDGYSDTTSSRAAPELGAAIGIDFHIRPVVLGLAWHSRPERSLSSRRRPARSSCRPRI